MQFVFHRCLLRMVTFTALFVAASAYAADGVWTGPGDAWTTDANWSPAAVPDGSASFANNGAPTSVSVSGGATLGSMQFDPDAPAYFFTVQSGNLVFTGGGIGANLNAPTFTVKSGLHFDSAASTAGNAVIINNNVTRFNNGSTAGNASITTNGQTLFTGSSTAGNATITTNEFAYTTFSGASDAGAATLIIDGWGGIDFGDNSSASNSTIINSGGSVNFNNSAKAGAADITNNSDSSIYFYTDGSAENANITNNGGHTYFFGASSAGDASITNTNGGRTDFYGSSTADSAVIITGNGGRTYLGQTSSGATAQFITTGTGVVDISNMYTAGTTAGSIEGDGTWQLGSKAITVGSLDTDTTVSGVIRDGGGAGGTGGSLVKVGSGTLTLSGANSYTGGTTISGGALQLGDGGASGGIVGDVQNNGALVFNRSDEFTFDGVISGGGMVNQIGPGVTALTGANAYKGATTVSAGTLLIDGDQSLATGVTMAAAGATLGGVGVIGSDVIIANGAALSPGGAGGTIGALTINGNLILNSGSALNYRFGEADVVGGPFNDLTVVRGDLTLAGTLNASVSPGGSFSPGIYRVISYDGALTNNGLVLGSMPPGALSIETSVANQINLVFADRIALNFWDGDIGPKNNAVVDGGDGVWIASADNDNWTDSAGAKNAQYADGSFAVFTGTAGVVQVDNSAGQVISAGMQFGVGGYVINGQPITLVETDAGSGEAIIRVGDGTAAGAGMAATIGAALQGAAQLLKDDMGALVLLGANTYTGGTTIADGVLQLGDGGAAGGIVGDVQNNGALTFNRSDEFIFDGAISGSGAVNQIGTGATVLTGVKNTYGGATSVISGSLRAGAVDAFSPNSVVTVAGPGVLDLNGMNQTVAGLNNAGLVNMGTGAAPGVVLTVTDAYVSNGGAIFMNTVANEGGAGSQSDMLAVNSTHFGLAPTSIVVNNAGGAGAATVGNGIQLVEVLDKKASADGVFTLGARVAAGAYDYNLFHNGVGGDAADGNWYLRSDLRPETPVYTAAPALASRLGLAMLGVYTNRGGDAGVNQFCAGEAETLRPTLYDKARHANPQCKTLFWGKVFGQTGEWGDSGPNSVSGNGPAYSFKLGGFLTGADLYRTARNNAGIYVGAGWIGADIQGVNGADAGRVNMNAYSTGVYWTHRNPVGWYTDLVLQGVWYEHINAHTFDAENLSTDGSGFAASAETGYALRLDSRYSFVPQAQLIYQRTSINNAADAFSQISFSAANELYGRLGGRLTGDWETGNWEASDERVLTIWTEANLWRQFGDDAKTTFASLQGANPTTFKASLGDAWAQFGFGFSGQITRNLSFFTQADYNIALNHSGYSLSGLFGIKASW